MSRVVPRLPRKAPSLHWLVLLGAMSPCCAKSVEVIGFGPLETETPAATSSPESEDEVGTPASSSDASVVAPLPDASTPLPDASAPLDAFAPPEQDAATKNQDAGSASAQGPFGAPSPLEDFAGSDDPSFTADGLEMYLDANDNDRIHVATRASRSDPWGEPLPVEAVGEDANGKTPWITPDGLQLYFAADRDGGAGVSDIWWLERPNRQSPWGVAQPLSSVNSPLEEFAPSLCADGLQLVLTRANVGLGGQELWLARRDSVEAPWQVPELMTVNDPTMKDSDAVLSPDGLEIWWVRGVSAGDDDLYVARRATADEPFATPMPAMELNSTAAEGDPWLSADGREIVFFSTRTGEKVLYRSIR